MTDLSLVHIDYKHFKMLVEKPPWGKKSHTPVFLLSICNTKMSSLLGAYIVLVNTSDNLVELYYLDTMTNPNTTASWL